jgi:hypothetical protein
MEFTQKFTVIARQVSDLRRGEKSGKVFLECEKGRENVTKFHPNRKLNQSKRFEV